MPPSYCLDGHQAKLPTVKTRINGPCARTLDLPLLVRSVFFYFFFVSGDAFFGAFSPPFPEEEISDYIAHGPFIRVFTVVLAASASHILVKGKK